MGVAEITQIALPTPFRIGAVNVYLLEGEPLTLVDTGPRWPESLDALETGLRARGHEIEDLELLLVTHQHCDHVGLADVIRGRSGAEVAAVGPLAEYLRDYEKSAAAEDDFAVEVMRRYGTPEASIEAIYAISRSFWRYGESVEVDRELAEGDEVVAGGRTLRVTMRPGHSPTDTVFVDEQLAVGVTGDHLLPRVSSNPVIHRPLDGSDDPKDRDHTLALYLESLRRTAELDLVEILPGHGPRTDAPGPLIESRVEHHLERMEKIAGLIAAGNTTVTDVAGELWRSLDDTQIYLAVSEVLGHTDLLIEAGRLREREQAGGISFELLED